MTRQARSIRCPESVLGWIPWYAEQNDDGELLLDARQRGAVEAHASECADCRAELDMIAGAPYRIDFEIPDPDRVFDEITARIDAGEAEGRDTAPAMPPTAFEGRAAGGRRLNVAELERLEDWVFDEDEDALAAEIERGAHATARVIEGPWSRPAYAHSRRPRLRGGPRARRPARWRGALRSRSPTRLECGLSERRFDDAGAVTDGPMIDVVFVESRTMDEVARALRAVGAEIVSGPSSVGRYRVRLDPAKLSPRDASAGVSADVAAVTARLKAGPDPVALFAEPVLK